MYQALYRKWRPRTFGDVVGQDNITETLRAQVASGRTSHAYLFTGTRGTGKTTCAKIFARAVNCEHPVDGNPCNACPSCLGIENGSILDVVEMDAASNNGIENVRDLRDDAIYSPASVKKRVYIIDEVHMLSPSAFNALLKIMEEPPEHLIFILATTELHKVPATILSRCQRYSFRRIPPEKIVERLSYIASREGLRLAPEAAEQLARLADGSMRDGVSLLDQCSSSANIDSAHVLSALGLAGADETAGIFRSVAAGDAEAALAALDRLYMEGKDVAAVLEELCSLDRDILITKLAPKGGWGLLSGSFDVPLLRSLAPSLDAPRLMAHMELLQAAAADLSRGGGRRTAAELCLIRLCGGVAPAQPSGLDAPAQPARSEAPAKAAPAPAPVFPVSEPAAAPIPPAPASEAPTAPAPSTAVSWDDILKALEKELDTTDFVTLSDASSVSAEISGGQITLCVNNVFTKSLIDRDDIKNAVRRSASALFGGQYAVLVADTAGQQVKSADKLDRLRKFNNIKFN